VTVRHCPTTVVDPAVHPIFVRRVNYADADEAQALVHLLDAYARDPAGGGEPLSGFAQSHLAAELAKRPQAFSFIAWVGNEPVGLINCIEGFSTFACQTLVNVHDVAVLASHRGRGVGRLLFDAAEKEAFARGACKLTLEVLRGNAPARRLYDALGFADYQLDPAMGHACFMQKWLRP
jgi:ribosomal protein S18 acetylase RimI-like enzyme